MAFFFSGITHKLSTYPFYHYREQAIFNKLSHLILKSASYIHVHCLDYFYCSKVWNIADMNQASHCFLGKMYMKLMVGLKNIVENKSFSF